MYAQKNYEIDLTLEYLNDIVDIDPIILGLRDDSKPGWRDEPENESFCPIDAASENSRKFLECCGLCGVRKPQSKTQFFSGKDVSVIF